MSNKSLYTADSCPSCNGKGTLPPSPRKFQDGTVDPTDIAGKISGGVCWTCGGAGKKPVPVVVVERAKLSDAGF